MKRMKRTHSLRASIRERRDLPRVTARPGYGVASPPRVVLTIEAASAQIPVDRDYPGRSEPDVD